LSTEGKAVIMSLLAIGIQIVLGLFFTPEGVIKWTSIGPSTARFTHFRYPQWFRYVTGVVEVLVGMGLLVGLWFPGIAALAALGLIVEMVIAIYSHLVRGKDAFMLDAVPATVFLVMALVVLMIHWENLVALAK
jgi:putative oxidoreductase